MTTPSKLNEFNYAEAPARQLLEQLGWVYVPREALATERVGEREVLLKGRLRAALLRLNEWMTEESQADRAIFELENINATGIARNQAVHEYLTYGMPLMVDGPRGRTSHTVRFFDFDHPNDGLNEFLVTTQFRVRRGNERDGPEDDDRLVIPDLVLFVNGIPLVVMEAKSPSLMEVWKTKAVRQLRRYQEAGPEWQGRGAPELFRYNLLCVAHCGAAAAYATLGAPENAYFEWKWLGHYSEDEVRQQYGVEPQGQNQLIVGLLSPATLLDILRDYVIYEQEPSRLLKKIPRYQQYRAVRATVDRIIAGAKPADRGGVIWHTQGSGKSLTMLWLATKVRRSPQLANSTIVTLTDRTQLDDQIANTFKRCGFPAPDQIDRSRPESEERRRQRRARNSNQPDPLDLQTALQHGGGRTLMTTIQKFQEVMETPSGSLGQLNDSENIIIMVDEAHRTQYGLLGAKMAQALPNAVLVGFTGTPIDRGFRRSTMRHFGPLIDAYTIPQSVADGATVRIMYEARLPDLAIQGSGSLDELFEATFSDLSEDERALISRRYANKDTVAEAEQRIEMISRDVAKHFKEAVKTNGFKAQVVAPSRAAALRYSQKLSDLGIRAYPIITTSPNDGKEFQVARRINHAQKINDFVNPQGEAEVLVVVDMLLTGFDAPVEQVLYLDRSLREHGLLQAVARVNRRFSHEYNGVVTEKNYGLVIDYYGVSQNLQEALDSFEWSDVQETLTLIEDDPTTVLDSAAGRAESHFKGRDLDDTWECVGIFAADENTEGNFKADLFERFNADYREFSNLMDRSLPDPKALPYVDRLARLTEIRAYSRALYLQENANLDWTDIGAKVKKLIDERIDATVRKLMEPISLLADDFTEKLASLPHDEARASLMEHSIRAYINTRLVDNPAFFEKLSDQLERIIRDLRNQLINSAEAARLMSQIKTTLETEVDIAAEYGLSRESFAIYELLQSRASETTDNDAGQQRIIEPELKNLANSLEKAVNQHRAVVDWQFNSDVQRLIRRDIKRALRPLKKYSEDHLDELANQIVEMAQRWPG